MVQDELIDELQVRGIGIGTVEEMRKLFGRAIRLKKEGTPLLAVDNPFIFEEDDKAVRQKMIQIEQGIETIDTPQGSKKHVKFETQLHHTLGRLKRSKPTTQNDEQKRSELLAKVLSLMTDLEDKLKSQYLGGLYYISR